MNKKYERWKRLADDPYLRAYCVDVVNCEPGGLKNCIERGNFYDAVYMMEFLVARLRVAAGDLNTEIMEAIEFYSKVGEQHEDETT